MAKVKICFEDLREETQDIIRKQVRDDILQDKVLELSDLSDNEQEDEIDKFRDSKEHQEDIEHYINKNNIGVEYEI